MNMWFSWENAQATNTPDLYLTITASKSTVELNKLVSRATRREIATYTNV